MADQTITLQPGDTLTVYAAEGQQPDAQAAPPTDPAATPDASPADQGVQPADPSPQGVGEG